MIPITCRFEGQKIEPILSIWGEKKTNMNIYYKPITRK